MTFSRTALPLSAWIGVPVLALALLSARPASACRSNEECKSPRICSMGVCVNPPAASAAQCERDIDCGGQDVCESNRCVPMMSTIPNELPTAPGEQSLSNEPAGPPEPGLQITPHKSAPPPGEASATPPEAAPPVDAPPPPPAQPPPPPRPRPPRPPPDARIVDNTPESAPPTYPIRRPKAAMGPRFDAFAGAGVMFLQNEFRESTALGIALDAQFLVGVVPELALGIRGGGIIEPGSSIFSTSLFYAAPGVFLPHWHWGFFVGWASGSASPKDPRLNGVELEIPYEYSFAPFLKLGLVFGIGIFRSEKTSLGQQNIRLEIGF